MIFSMDNSIPYTADSKELCDNALEMINGDYSGASYKSYLNMYPHQVGLQTYLLVLAKIFNDNFITVARLINLVITIFGYYYLYKITDMIFNNKKINTIVITLNFICSQFIIISLDVYGNSILCALGIISIFYFIKFLKNHKAINLLCSSSFLAFSILIKPNNVIMLTAMLIYLIIYIFNNKKIKFITLFIIPLIASLLVFNSLKGFYEYKGETQYNKSMPPISWIAFGLNYNPSTPGMHFPDINKFYIDSDLNIELTKEMSYRYIGYTLTAFKNNPILIPKFLVEKLSASYAIPDMGILGHFIYQESNPIYENIIKYEMKEVLMTVWDATYIVMGLGVLIFSFSYKKNNDLVYYFIATIVFGGFLYHLISEIHAKYLLQYVLLIVPYASYGIFRLNERISYIYEKK